MVLTRKFLHPLVDYVPLHFEELSSWEHNASVLIFGSLWLAERPKHILCPFTVGCALGGLVRLFGWIAREAGVYKRSLCLTQRQRVRLGVARRHLFQHVKESLVHCWVTMICEASQVCVKLSKFWVSSLNRPVTRRAVLGCLHLNSIFLKDIKCHESLMMKVLTV